MKTATEKAFARSQRNSDAQDKRRARHQRKVYGWNLKRVKPCAE